jgi:hypothetical protein
VICSETQLVRWAFAPAVVQSAIAVAVMNKNAAKIARMRCLLTFHMINSSKKEVINTVRLRRVWTANSSFERSSSQRVFKNESTPGLHLKEVY